MSVESSMLYLLRQSPGLSGYGPGLAGRNRQDRRGGSGGGEGAARPPANRAARQAAKQSRARLRGAAQITGAATEGLARIIEAARGPQAAEAAPAPLAPADDPYFTGTLGPEGVAVATPWGKIALGGAAVIIVLGGIAFLVTRKRSSASGSATPVAAGPSA